MPVASSCPICNCADTRRLRVVPTPYLDRSLLYDVMSCTDCDHMWCVGETGSEVLERIYSTDFHGSSQQLASSGGNARSPVVENAWTRAAKLTSRSRTGRLLDVGAGNGYFVDAARRHGFDAEGVDIAPEAAVVAARNGVKVHVGDFQQMKDLPGYYDIITMWDVLCGFPDPHKAMARVGDLIAPGGFFVATVCDRSSRMARLSGRFWPLLIPPVNLHYFSRDSMNRLLAAHGFSTVDFHHEGKSVSLRFVGQKLLRTLRLAPLEGALAPLIPSGWRVTLNLGDIATVVATRTSPEASGVT